MAEPVGKRGRWSGGSGAGRGGRGGWGGRGRRPRAQRSPSRGTLDVVSVDLVTDSDEEILEVATARGAADEVEVEPPEPPGPVASRDNSNSDSEGEDRRPAGPPREPVRRRRRLVLDPGEAPLVPVYSGKVKSSLRLIPDDLSLLKLYPPGDEEGKGGPPGRGTQPLASLKRIPGVYIPAVSCLLRLKGRAWERGLLHPSHRSWIVNKHRMY
uniref:cDNA FLJ57775, highly similar to Homo sapiens nuclear factor of activated T-cells, cytoplasmic, calcineurin-dependent 2 interacting protein, mRNA n=1 Tax=Homo sapiens TaxID=9606 RepID=B7Z8Y9_HUMAN|nr:unnamed protein product [Homo sapiens]